MSYHLYRPETAEEAVRLQQTTGGTYLAGGTVTLVNAHRRKNISPDQISLDRIDALRGIVLRDNVLSIGSMTTMDDLEESTEVREHAFALWQAAESVGGPQIRNRATIGGNIAAASPASDCVTPLLALNASLRVLGADGERLIPLRAFYIGYLTSVLRPDEIILSVEIPVIPGRTSAFRKVGKRNALAIACINMAVVRENGTVSAAVGSAAPTAVYCAKTSALLSEDIRKTDEAKALILTEISPIDDRLATASYRRKVCVNLLDALLEETGEAEKVQAARNGGLRSDTEVTR